MDIQELFEATLAKRRQEKMKDSPQITLGELKLLLEQVENKYLPVIFDFDKKYPSGLNGTVLYRSDIFCNWHYSSLIFILFHR